MHQKGSVNIILLIIIVVLAAAVGYFALTKKVNAPQTETPPAPEIKTFQHSFWAFFEGWDAITFEFNYPADAFEVTAEERGPVVKLKNLKTNEVDLITLTNESGRGFSPNDYWNEVLSKNCATCKQIENKTTLNNVSEVLTFENNEKEWIIFYSKFNNLSVPALVIAEFSKPAGEAEKILSSFKITDFKSGLPASEFNVYFFNEKIKPNVECNEVVEVFRIIPKTEKIATAAIEELLKGPTEAEKNQGYTTVIPAGSKLNSLKIEDGVAYADFNALTESGGGSCSMRARTEQIRKTLLQFPTVKSVKLSIDGRTGDIFQP